MCDKDENMRDEHIIELEIRPTIDQEESRIKYSRSGSDFPNGDEIKIAKFLVKHYDTEIIFLPVRTITDMKNPDIMIGCALAEMKHIVGNRRQIGKAFRNATKQAQTIILWIEPKKEKITVKSIRNKIHGEIRDMIKKGTWEKRKPNHLVIIFGGNLYSWRLYKKSKPQ